jgi:hypothetical protein
LRLHAISLLLLLTGSCADAGTAPVTADTPEGETAADAAPDTPAPVDIAGLTVEANPICDLSCVVRWSTPAPAPSWVEVGLDGLMTHRIGDGTPVTEHEVIVVGLAPDTQYDLAAVSGDARSGPLTCATGPGAPGWMGGTVDLHDPAQAWNGWNLANVLTGTATDEPLILVLLDMEGRPVWTYQGPMGSGRGDIHVSMIDDRYVLVGGGFSAGTRPFMMDLKGDIIWEGPPQPGGDGPVPNLLVEGTMHHGFYRLDDGTYVVIENTIRDGIIGDRVRHFDAADQTLWLWDAFDHLGDPHVAALGQWLHTNSVVLEPDAGTALISCMALGTIFEVEHPSGDVRWALGDGGDFAPDPAAAHPWFHGGHGVDRLPDGHLLLYDNGTAQRGFSRAVEYALDEEAMTATIVWEYPGDADDTWFNGAMGDADALPNGNVFISAGNGVQKQSASRLLEVTRSGEKVWEMWWYDDGETRSGCYQADRIPSLLQPL